MEKCIYASNKETGIFLSHSTKFQEFKNKQFENHQVLIDQETANPRNVWIVCEQSQMTKAEGAVRCFLQEQKISSQKFLGKDPIKFRFLKEHCWDKIKEKESNSKSEGVIVQIDPKDSGSFELKGTDSGRKDMNDFLCELERKVIFKVRRYTKRTFLP